MSKVMHRVVVLMAVISVIGLTAQAASTAGSPPSSFPNIGLNCARGTVTVKQAVSLSRSTVLVWLEEWVNGKPRNVASLPVKLFRGKTSRVVGKANPMCWTMIPVLPGKPGKRPNLCIQLRPPLSKVFVIYKSNPKDPKPAACPTPRLYGKGAKWVGYVFKIVQR